MQGIFSALTCMLFAAHVVLGCCAHHAHGDKCHSASDHSTDACALHAEPGRSDSDRHPSGGDDHRPTDEGDHVSCSYVKAEIARLDLSDSLCTFMPIETVVGADLTAGLAGRHPIQPSARFVPGAELYVWHCALLI